MAGLSVGQIRALFAQEAEGRLQSLSRLLLELEHTGGDDAVISAIFREVHTLKGSAAVAGLDHVSAVAHELEELVDDLRAGRRLVTPDVIDTLLAGSDRLEALISAPADDAAPVASGAATGRPDAQPAAGAAPVMNGHDVNGRASERDAPGGPAANGHGKPGAVAAPAPSPTPPPSRGGPNGSSAHSVVIVPTERLEELIRLVGEAASAHLRVGRLLTDRFDVTEPASYPEFNDLSRLLNQLQDKATRTQMVPVSTITDQLRRAVRDLARAQGKDVRWDERGADTELDRGVLRQLSDSLIHLVRNAVDHGIELPAERVAAGKPRHATIRLHAMQLGSEVIIAVTDDGRGIDVERVRERAARQGVDTDGLTEQELLELTMRPGLSTTSFVTDISGRGVGLDVVKSNVEAARGRVEIRSELGRGSEFRIVVPITLAVLRCLLVEAGGQRFALPFHRVVLTQAYDLTSQSHAEGRSVVWVNDQPVTVSALAHTLGLGRADSAGGPIVVLADGARRHAFYVDQLVGQRDVVLKGLSPVVLRVPAVAGASVEPDGSILVVLDPPGLIARAQHANRVAVLSPDVTRDGPRPRVLVVDDALTVRELQRSILERAGFDVRVAVDGSQALAKLAEETADVVLTDIEMPIMDGFALTTAIRAHPTLANIPVLILSSRASDGDRQRGLDAGADGYIAKSGFDEAGLLSAVHRLLGARV